MVNRENVMRLAKAFATKELAVREVNPIGYNQGSWYETRHNVNDDHSGNFCQTTACVAGWAIHLLADGQRKRHPDGYAESHEAAGTRLLGLDGKQAAMLFYTSAPECYDKRFATCTVAACLKHLAETGEVDWRRAATEAREANEQVG